MTGQVDPGNLAILHLLTPRHVSLKNQINVRLCNFALPLDFRYALLNQKQILLLHLKIQTYILLHI
jgi:hypothetical protein